MIKYNINNTCHTKFFYLSYKQMYGSRWRESWEFECYSTVFGQKRETGGNSHH